MIDTSVRTQAWKDSFTQMVEGLFSITSVKPDIVEWIGEKVRLPKSVTPYPGPYDFDRVPFMKPIAQFFHPSDPTRWCSVIKDGQSGFTTLIIAALLYRIRHCPSGMLLTSADLDLAKKTMKDRFDPVVQESGMQSMFRPHVVKKTNNATGDTQKSKEFPNGHLYSLATNSATVFRMFTSLLNINDDFDAAPKELGKEGSPKMVIKTRQTALGDKAKTFMLSTPTDQFSNIYEQYLLGTQEKWTWPCPGCGGYFIVEFQTRNDNGDIIGGLMWELDSRGQAIAESIHYCCPHCRHKIYEQSKYELNLNGLWLATQPEPLERRHKSYWKNGIYNPPGWDGWVTFADEWMAANPHGARAITKLLKTFNNLRLGLIFEDRGAEPRVNDLMKNTRNYLPGTIPDKTCLEDGNGKIILLTLSCDINGIMEDGLEDVRLDWELVAHSASTSPYSIDHGSIGTFKRSRDKTKHEKDHEDERVHWTITHNVANSVWPVFEEIMRREYVGESGEKYRVHLTLVDAGHGQKHVIQFVKGITDMTIFAIRGHVEENFRPVQRDTQPVKRSPSMPECLYFAEVNQLKDELAESMLLRKGDDGTQPAGFMNYPQPRDGKYTMGSFFSHYEGERRVTEEKNGQIVGYKWVKKHGQVQNHFWDVRVYNMAAVHIFIDLVRRENSAYKNFNWENLVQFMS